MNSYLEFIDYLDRKEIFGIKFGLDNINNLLERLGSPHKKLHFIHVAGTNGKGSVCAMLSSVLTKSGIKTGLYTSPHLIDVKERIRLNEKDISEDDILQVAKRVISLSMPEITYFELLTAIAIEYFYEKGVELAIMETGMGGRLDATNVCFGEIAIITDISLDHTNYLGKTVEEIKKEKMAIAKKGCALISAHLFDNNYRINSRNLDYQTAKINGYDNIRLNLLGDHQARNCALALKAIDVLKEKGYNISFKSIYGGLKEVRWPGRFQVLSKEPLIVIDGAHNPGAAVVLKDTVEKYIGRNVILIIGILKDKDYKNILRILSPVAKKIFTVTPKDKRAFHGEILKDFTKNKCAEYKNDLGSAVESAKKEGLPILITGSLYLAGEAITRI